MIQRIQSVFMGLAAIAMIAFLGFPIVRYTSELHLFQQFAFSFHDMLKTGDLPAKTGGLPAFSAWLPYPVGILAIMSIVFSVFTIFQFKNRLHQMKLLKYNIILLIILMAGIFFVYPYIVNETTGGYNTYEMGAYFPLISFVFLILAFRYVRKDEELVKSLERFR